MNKNANFGVNIEQKINARTVKFRKLLEESVIIEDAVIQNILCNKNFACMQIINKYCFFHRVEIYNKIVELHREKEDNVTFDDILSDSSLSVDSRLTIARLMNSKIQGVSDIKKAIVRLNEISYLLFIYKKFLEVDNYITNESKVNRLSVHQMLRSISGEFLESFNDSDVEDVQITPTQFIDRFEDFSMKSETILLTGSPYLDNFIENGYKAGDLLIIGARPGGGKTAFCIDLLVKNKEKLLNSKKACLYFTPDMSIVNMYYRLISRLTGIKYNAISKTSKEKFKNEVKDFPIIMSSCSNLSEILALIEVNKKTISVIVIDYIQIVHADNRASSRNEEIGFIIGKLKEAVRKHGMLLIFVAQLSRDTEKRSELCLSDIRDSGFLEQEADVVLFLTKDMDNTVDIRIMKNRYGPCAVSKSTLLPEDFSFV